MDATPAGAWEVLASASPPRQLASGPDEALNWLFHASGAAHDPARRIDDFPDPLLASDLRGLAGDPQQVLVRYHPEDISRIFVSSNGKNYLEVGYADVRRPRISLWEQRTVCRILRAEGQR